MLKNEYVLCAYEYRSLGEDKAFITQFGSLDEKVERAVKGRVTAEISAFLRRTVQEKPLTQIANLGSLFIIVDLFYLRDTGGTRNYAAADVLCVKSSALKLPGITYFSFLSDLKYMKQVGKNFDPHLQRQNIEQILNSFYPDSYQVPYSAKYSSTRPRGTKKLRRLKKASAASHIFRKVGCPKRWARNRGLLLNLVSLLSESLFYKSNYVKLVIPKSTMWNYRKHVWAAFALLPDHGASFNYSERCGKKEDYIYIKPIDNNKRIVRQPAIVDISSGTMSEDSAQSENEFYKELIEQRFKKVQVYYDGNSDQGFIGRVATFEYYNQLLNENKKKRNKAISKMREDNVIHLNFFKKY